MSEHISNPPTDNYTYKPHHTTPPATKKANSKRGSQMLP